MDGPASMAGPSFFAARLIHGWITEHEPHWQLANAECESNPGHPKSVLPRDDRGSLDGQ